MPFPTGLGSGSTMTLRDFNGDGFVDLVVPVAGTNKLAVYLGKGDGTREAVADKRRPKLRCQSRLILLQRIKKNVSGLSRAKI
jgi:hypothetical protein